MPIKPLLVLLAPLAMLALTGCGKEAAQPPRPALTQQVDYGAGAYRYGCGRCHASGRSSVELTAEQLTAKYTTADQLYEFVRRSMPLDEPGSLPDGDYWAIVAYVLDNTGLLALPRESELGPRTARSILISPRPAVSVERVTTASGPE